jgi:hypothetical protein
MINLSTLSSSQLKRAADLKDKIAKLENDLAAILGGSVTVKPAKKGGMSAAGRAKIAAAQKARWAKVKAAKTKASPKASKPVKKARKKMSAEGRAKIVAAQKARWAKIKAEKAAKK